LNKGTLPILARLQSLQADMRVMPGGGRVIAEADDRKPLAQLLRAANETMLGRSLEFVSSAGSALTLDVAGRRVLRLTASHGLSGAESCLGAEVLEDEHKDDLIKLLQAVATPRQELKVISGPIGRGGAEVSVGLPVALLADLLLIDLNEIGPGEPLPIEEAVVPDPGENLVVELAGKSIQDFAKGIGPALTAWLILGGEDSGQSDGPEEMVSHLQGFLDDEHDSVLRQLDLMSMHPGDPICLMLGATLIEGHSILCARLQDAMLLGVIEGDGMPAALAAWNALLHQAPVE
jgi:hypothetical protein